MLPNITRTYSGVLQCVAWNGIGKNASANVTLNVLCEYLGNTTTETGEIMIVVVV